MPDDSGWWIELVRPEMTVLDIGANVGDITIPLAKLATHGRVHAIEPGPEPYQRLCARVQELQNVMTYPLAIGLMRGRRRVFHYRDWTLLDVDPQNAKYIDREYHPGQATDLKGEFEVMFVSLDEFVLTYLDRGTLVGFIKIDVDGAEGQVVRSGLEVLKRDRPILVVEIGRYTMKEFGDTPEPLLELLESSGYRFRNGHDAREMTRDQVVSAIPGDGAPNVVCIP